jgi:hypothetical protein
MRKTAAYAMSSLFLVGIDWTELAERQQKAARRISIGHSNYGHG